MAFAIIEYYKNGLFVLNKQLTGANNKNVVEASLLPLSKREELNRTYISLLADGVRTTRSNLTLKTNKRGMKGRQERLGKYFFTAQCQIL